MKSFIIYGIKLLICIIIMLCIADFAFTKIYQHSEPRNKLQYVLKTSEQNFDIVFMGSSRVANHIDTQLFDSLSHKKTLNLGVEGAGLNDNFLLMKLLVNNNKVDNIYLQLDSNFQNEKPSNIATSEAMPFVRHDSIINSHIQTYLSGSKKLINIPFYRYALNDPKIGFREALLSLSGKKPRIDPSIGFIPKFGNKTKSSIISLPNTIKNNNSILDEMIKLCKKNNIQLVLFIAPYCSKTKNRDYITKLNQKFPDLINLSTGYDDSLFYNCSHLNSKGARKFTRDLYNRSAHKIIKINKS